MLGQIIAKGKSVTLPQSSTLIKLANLPKNIPTGATLDTRSESWKKLIEYFLLKRKIEIIEETVDQENIVKCPMVGVAYLSADPSSPSYVKVGQHVKQGDTLLLIEAMKTFNEIKAPKSGVIKKIVVLNSQPVEFGDDLIIFE